MGIARGDPINHDPAELIPTQDLSPLLEENSNLYAFTANSFASTGRRIGRNPMMFRMNAVESIDIDTEEDWSLAEALLRLRASEDQ